MNRGWIAGLVVVVAVALSGCSTTEVQYWMAIYGHKQISTSDARALADKVNAKLPAGHCDKNYSGGCVPDNASVVHCAGLPGDGPAVAGPLRVVGWDDFGLDTDHDKVACPGDPFGGVDSVHQSLDGITVNGWAIDPDTPEPVRVDVVDGASSTQLTASGSRPDVAAVYPSAGAAHGFSVHFAAGLGVQNVCVYADNQEGGGAQQLLGCATVDVVDVTDIPLDGHETTALLEGAERVSGGIHVWGFVYDDRGTNSYPAVNSFVVGDSAPGTTLDSRTTSVLGTLDVRTVDRADVQAVDPAAPLTSGFDQVISPTTATSVCLATQPAASPVVLSCRPIGQ